MPLVKAFKSLAAIAVPVVIDAPLTFTNFPAANAAEAFTCKTTVSSVAAVINSTKVADVPVVPVWATDNNLPAPVMAVAAEATDMPMPVVKASRSPITRPDPVVTEAPDRLTIFPSAKAPDAFTWRITVSSVAAEMNSLRVPLVLVAPLWVLKNSRPAPVIAVALDANETNCPVVSALPTTETATPLVKAATGR